MLCSRSSATTTCRVSPKPHPTRSMRSWPRAPGLPRRFSSRSTRSGIVWAAQAMPDGSVTSPPGFKDAYRLHVEGGWPALAGDAAYGGQGLPLVLGTVMNEFYASANMAFSMYPGLTQSACSAILAHGDENQKALFAPKLISGRMVGHHEPDGAPLRHRPRADQDEGGAGGRRVLCAARAEDLHFRRRARSGGKHRPSRAGQDRRRARRHQGPVAVHRAQDPGEPGRLARGPQRTVLRIDRAQDGHPRQPDLRDELRRRERASCSAKRIAAFRPCS